jgi:hypothetical protein
MRRREWRCEIPVSLGPACSALLVVRHVGEPTLVSLRLHAAAALLSPRFVVPSHVEVSLSRSLTGVRLPDTTAGRSHADARRAIIASSIRCELLLPILAAILWTLESKDIAEDETFRRRRRSQDRGRRRLTRTCSRKPRMGIPTHRCLFQPVRVSRLLGSSVRSDLVERSRARRERCIYYLTRLFG